jgi:tetratricopeptide (TPR) repeat protein
MISTLLIVLVTGLPAGSARQPSNSGPGPDRGEAYYQFLLGRHLDENGDAGGAIAALQRAASLDRKSADIRAELAGVYARTNRLRQAIETGEAALALDPDHREAHRTLGTIYAALADGAQRRGGSAAASAEFIGKAISHLERARRTGDELGIAMTLGRLYVADRRYDRAVEVLAPVIEAAPDSPDVALLAAEAYEGAGRTDDAVRVLKGLLAADPTSLEGRTALAELFEREGRWKEAAETYAAPGASDDRESLESREASAWINAGDPARARALLEKVVARQPSNAGALYLLGEAERRTGDLARAEATARRLAAIEPGGTRGPLLLARIHESQHNPAGVVATLAPAVASLEAGKAAPAETSLLLLHLGFAYLDQEQPAEAARVLEKATALAPADPATRAGFIQAVIGTGDHRRAVDLARSARGRFAGDARFTRLEATALFRAGDRDAAVALLKDALGAAEGDADLHRALAGLYVEARDLGRAEAVLDAASRRFPGDVDLKFELAAVLEQQRRYGDAERVFRQVLADDPRHAQALNYLGYMLAELGERLDESIGLIRRALEVDPYNGAYLDSLGWAYLKQDRLDLAEAPLIRAGEQLVRNSVVQDHVGDLLFRLGRFGQAVEAWKRALAGDGESIVRSELERKIRMARERARRER